MNRRGTVFLGVILIAFGIALLFNEYGFGLNIRFSWPVFLFFTGAILVAAYYTSRPKKGFLVGGLIMICLSFFFTALEDVPAFDLNYRSHWPGILIAIGIGMIISGIVDSSLRKFISSGILLGGIGVLFLIFNSGGWRQYGSSSIELFFGIVLLLIGVKVVIDVFIKKKAEA